MEYLFSFIYLYLRNVWVEEQLLIKNKVKPWTELPLWISEKFPLEGETEPWKDSFFISIEKAVNAGLSFRPIEDTIWEKARQDTERKAGISRESEAKLLEIWSQKEKL